MIPVEQLVLDLARPPEPSLENFLVGRNGAALAALATLLDGSETTLYLWGETGAGKTHLLRALAAKAHATGMTSRYVSSGLAREDLSGTHLACVDEVEKLDANDQTGLFDFYNLSRTRGGALAAAGRVPPTDLALREDLRTRLASGVVLQLHPLSEAEKRAAITENARGRGVALRDEVLDYLLLHHARDMRSLMVIVDALDQYSLRTRRPVTLPLLRETLKHGSNP